MNTQTGIRAVQDAAIGVGVATTPEGLSAIGHPGCAGAIYQRPPNPAFQAWIDGLDPARLPSGRIIVRADALSTAVTELCEVAGTPDCPERRWLADDIAALGDVFAQLMGAAWVRLRLDAVSGNACRKFHVDAITARLICTYRGVGTQYGISTDGAEPSRVFTVPTGSPIVLCGSLWPDDKTTGLLHRSPPIEGTGATRLVLVLDPVNDPEAEY